MLSMCPWTWSAFAKRWLLLGLCFCPWQLLLFRCQLGPGVETQWLTVTRLVLEQLMDCNHCDYTPGPVGTASWESVCSTSWWLAWWRRGLPRSHNQASSLSDHQDDEPWSSLFWDKLATSAFGRNVVPPLLGIILPSCESNATSGFTLLKKKNSNILAWHISSPSYFACLNPWCILCGQCGQGGVPSRVWPPSGCHQTGRSCLTWQ